MKILFRKLALVSLVSVIALAAGACSNDDDQEPVTPIGGNPDAPPSHGTDRVGLILFQWAQGRVDATALFSGSATAGQSDPCVISQVGPCSISVCPHPPDDAPDALLATAGTLTVTGGSTTIQMEPSTFLDNQYDVTQGNLATFTAGATVSVSSSGGEVPAFGAHSAKMPVDIQVTPLPELIDFTQDLDVAWSGGGADGMVVVELLSDDDVHTGSLSCSFAPTAHHGTVPAAALAVMPACGIPGTACAWIVSPKDNASFTAGDFAIDFRVTAGGMAGMYSNP